MFIRHLGSIILPLIPTLQIGTGEQSLQPRIVGTVKIEQSQLRDRTDFKLVWVGVPADGATRVATRNQSVYVSVLTPRCCA